MQYNKHQFNKINDKKMMKKVKKQWAVVSVATLAFIGASALGTMSTNSAKADVQPSAVSVKNSNVITKNNPDSASGVKDIPKAQQPRHTDSTNSVDNKNSYDGNQNAYQTALNDARKGDFSNTNSKDPEYAKVYNDAKLQATNAYNNGDKLAENNPLSENNSHVSNNSSIQEIFNDGFNQVKDGFNSVFNGNTIKSPTTANTNGINLGNTAKEYVDELAENVSTYDSLAGLPQSLINEVNKIQQQAQNAFNGNPDINVNDYSDNNPFDKYVSQPVLANLQSDYKKGAKRAATLADNDKISDKAYTQGYQDYMDGLKSVITPNATSINNPNSAQKAGMDEKDNYIKGYDDGLNGITNPNNSDPVYKQANASVKQALQDFASGTTKSDDEINAMSLVQQTAYKNALVSVKYAPETGANKFVSGENRPEGNQGISEAMRHGYDDAKSGFETAEHGTKFSNLTNNQKNNPSFMIGFNTATQAYADAVKALKDNRDNPARPADKNTAYTKAYNDAIARLQTEYNINATPNQVDNDSNQSGFDDITKTFKHGMDGDDNATDTPQTDAQDEYAKAGYKRGKLGELLPRGLKPSYARAYIAAYKRAFNRFMPRYIYNIKTIYTHNNVRYSYKTRTTKYAYTKRYNSTVFHVFGVRFTKHGTPRYVLKHGLLVTANRHYVRNAYYNHNFKTFHVIKPSGVLVHTSKKFYRRNVARKISRGQDFKVIRVVKYHGLTRLYIGHGEYVTSNKTYVKFGRK